MSDVSDVAPLPSTPSKNGDPQEMDVGASPGGGNNWIPSVHGQVE